MRKSFVPLMEASYLYSLVYDSIASECAVDETDMADYYAEQKDQIRSDYTELKVATILVDDEETANEVAKRAKGWRGFCILVPEI